MNTKQKKQIPLKQYSGTLTSNPTIKEKVIYLFVQEPNQPTAKQYVAFKHEFDAAQVAAFESLEKGSTINAKGFDKINEMTNKPQVIVKELSMPNAQVTSQPSSILDDLFDNAEPTNLISKDDYVAVASAFWHHLKQMPFAKAVDILSGVTNKLAKDAE